MILSVTILMVFVIISLVLALRFLVFKSSDSNVYPDKGDKKVVNLLTLRIVFSAILLALSYLYLSSI